MASIVTPGTVIGTADSKTPGEGVIERKGDLVALLTGTPVENDGWFTVGADWMMLSSTIASWRVGHDSVAE